MKNLKYWVEKKCQLCGKDFWSFIKRNGRFCSNVCSTTFTANDIDRIKNIKKTKLERYGCETYVNPEKAKQTCLEKYGVDNASKSVEVIEKIKKVNRERFGVEWFWQADEVKKKIRETNFKRYGVEYSSQSSVVKQKKIDSYLKRYGVSNPFQCKEIKEIIKKQYNEKYGAEYPSQIEEIRKKISEIVRKNNYRLLNLSSKIINTVEILFPENEYFGASSEFKYKVKCQKCNNVFLDHFDGNGHPRCLICHPNMAGFSYAEKEIVEYIKSLIPEENIICRDRS